MRAIPPQNIAARLGSSAPGETTDTPLSTDVYRSHCRRLAALSLVYVVGYTVAWGSNYVIRVVETGRLGTITEIMSATIAIGFGLFVHAMSRGGKLPQRSFANLASAFLIVGCVGIVMGAWGWQIQAAERMRTAADALGIGLDAVRTGFVDPLDAVGIRLMRLDGISWAAVFVLMYPVLIPSSPRRTLISSTIATTACMGVLFLSLLVLGVPEVVAPWIPEFLIDVAIPSYICVGLAWLGSHTVYRLTRDLSRARRMGSYELVELIGEGGMGEVWRARHRMLARPAAIKLIRPDALEAGDRAESIMRRFAREAQATAALQSPHSIRLYDFGVTDDGVFYYVMELLSGFDLRTLVERFGVLPAPRVIHILGQVCHSLEDAHNATLVHRDIKPANIFVCRRGIDADFVKVLDFGLVKETGEEQPDQQLTRDEIAPGTPAFMAPERAMGNRDADPRMDLYAVGCVGYWLLTGGLVFEADSPMATILQHVSAEPDPPSTRTEVEVPEALDRLILDCLAKDPDQRPTSAGELRRRLIEIEREWPRWTEEEAREWWQRCAPDQPGRVTPS